MVVVSLICDTPWPETTVYADPASCPNDAPYWFSLFLFSNW